MLYIYYAVLFVAIVLGLLFGMALYRWFHYRDISKGGGCRLAGEIPPTGPTPSFINIRRPPPANHV